MVDIILANPTSGGTPVRSIGTSNQQIIVIPQSLFTSAANNQGIKKPIVKVSPSVMAKPSIVTNQNLTKIGLKRALSPEVKSNHSDGDEDDSTPVRKRANLDHMSPEEKLMRRKLKNRVAAQNARDKKRAKMEDMEVMIQKMEEETKKIREENEQLKKINERLLSENQSLKRNTRASVGSNNDYLLPPSPESMPPLSPGMADSTIVVPRPSEPAELTNELLPKGQGLGMAVSPSQKDKMATMAACLFWTCLVSPFLSKNNNNNWSTSENRSTSSSKSLPLKKRNSPTWWGSQQKSWNPIQPK